MREAQKRRATSRPIQGGRGDMAFVLIRMDSGNLLLDLPQSHGGKAHPSGVLLG